MNEQMDEIKERIDKAKDEQRKKLEQIAQLVKEQKANENKIMTSKAEKNEKADELKKQKKMLSQCEEEHKTQRE